MQPSRLYVHPAVPSRWTQQPELEVPSCPGLTESSIQNGSIWPFPLSVIPREITYEDNPTHTSVPRPRRIHMKISSRRVTVLNFVVQVE